MLCVFKISTACVSHSTICAQALAWRFFVNSFQTRDGSETCTCFHRHLTPLPTVSRPVRSAFSRAAHPRSWVMVPVCQASREKWQSRESVRPVGPQLSTLSLDTWMHQHHSQLASTSSLPLSFPIFFVHHFHSLVPHTLSHNVIYSCSQRCVQSRWENKKEFDRVKYRPAPCF